MSKPTMQKTKQKKSVKPANRTRHGQKNYRLLDVYRVALAKVAKPSGMSETKIVEDALADYFGLPDQDLPARRELVRTILKREQGTLQRHQ